MRNPGIVRLAWSRGVLGVLAEFVDDELVVGATGDTQKFWELGDVFEMFIRPEDVDEYAEMHVDPANHRLHLQLNPSARNAIFHGLRDPLDFALRPPGFQSAAWETLTGWAVEAFIPMRALFPGAIIGQVAFWSASFCRYDASRDGRPAALSSTSPHPTRNFHRLNEWRPLCF